LIGFFHTMGSATGPIIAGRVFDLRGSYSYAFEAFVVLLIIGAAAALACTPLPAGHATPAPATASA